MKPFQSHFVVIQLIFFIYYGQIASSQSSEDDCRSGYSCLKRSMCSPTAMKQIVGSPKKCGKSKRGAPKICCPLSTPTSFARNIQETEFQEPCGLKGEDLSLVGTEMTNGRWPWMVSLLNKRGEMERFLCSGFLIDRQHVVTAAHCVQGKHRKGLLARIGSASFRDGELYNVTQILVPEGYKPHMFYDDIALLTLSRQVESPHFNPVCLPTTNSVGALEGVEGTLVGYGGGFRGNSGLLEQNGVPIISSEECETTFLKLLSESFTIMFPKGINNQILCTGENGNNSDICRKIYSGSPLMVERKGRWFVVGVSTFGLNGCRRPDGFTRVTEYVVWIKQNVE